MSRNKYKVPTWIKHTIKNELYQFWKNQELIEELKQDIIESSPEPADGQPKGNATSNTVEQKAIKMLSSRRIIETERRIEYIKEAMKRLDLQEQEIVQLIFKERYNATLAETQKYITKDTYYNVYNKIIYFTALEFGYI